MKKETKLDYYSFFSFFLAVVFAMSSMILPPMGVIDNSILIWIAQLLTYSAACLQIIKKPTNLK